eukprot:2632455-Pyramimonas_sp.AAC.1
MRDREGGECVAAHCHVSCDGRVPNWQCDVHASFSNVLVGACTKEWGNGVLCSDQGEVSRILGGGFELWRPLDPFSAL